MKKLATLKKFSTILFSIFSLAFLAPFEMSCAENPLSKTIFHTLGNTRIPIKIEQFGSRTDLVYINLHDDESTSVIATRKLLKEEGGILIRIENKGNRNLRFRMGDRWYEMDPNRIFSREGIAVFLRGSGQYNSRVVAEVEKLGQRILQLFPKDPLCIIALHNNTDGNYSINEYLPGKLRAQDASNVYINPRLDPDDHFITTVPELFNRLSEKQYNVMLQDNENCNQDGSLSVYCGNNGIRYVNLETEHGKIQEYTDMIRSLYNLLLPENQTSKH